MIKYLFPLLAILFVGFIGHAQSFKWSKAIYGDFDNTGYCCAADKDGNYYFAGKFRGDVTFGDFELSVSENVASMFLLKTDQTGEILWIKKANHVESTKATIPYDIRVDDQNNIFIVGKYCHQTRFGDETVLEGYSDQDGNIDNDCFVAKYSSPEGDLVWVKGFSGRGNDQLEAIALEGSTIYVGGYFRETLEVQGKIVQSEYPNVGNSSNPFIMALSTDDGTVSWIDVFHCYSGVCRELEVENNQLYFTVESRDNIWMQQVGSTEKFFMKKSTGSTDVYLGKLDATTGNAVWYNLIGSEGMDQNYCLDVHENKVVAGGSYRGHVTFESKDGNFKNVSEYGSTDTYFCQYNSDGNLEWNYALGGESADLTNGDLVIDDEGNMFASGYFRSPSINLGSETITSDDTEMYLIKLNNQGEFQEINQSQSLGKKSYLQSLTLVPTGDIVFTATSTGSTKFLSKNFSVSGDHEQMIFGVITDTETAVDNLLLADVRVYPNPTSSIIEVTADFRIEQLQLFDHVGKLVLSSQTDKMDLTILEKGIYLLRIDGDAGQLVRKVIKE